MIWTILGTAAASAAAEASAAAAEASSAAAQAVPGGEEGYNLIPGLNPVTIIFLVLLASAVVGLLGEFLGLSKPKKNKRD